MSCEICGRSSCTRSFHSLQDQKEYDDQADKVKEYIKNKLTRAVNRLKNEEFDDDLYVKLDDVINLIDDIN